MKKIIAILLSMLMLASLAACSSDTTPSWEKDREDDSNDIVIVDEEDEEDDEDDVITVDDDDSSIDTSGMFIPGTNTATSYRNEYLGIGADFDYGWIIYAGEDLNSQNGISEDLTGDELIEKLNSTYVFYDLLALPTDGNPNVNIAIENLPMANAGNLTTLEYLNIVSSSIESSLLSSGYDEVSAIEQTTATFAGEQCAALLISGKANGNTICQYMVFTKVDKLMVLITVTAYDAPTAKDVLDCFYAID